ncbi:Proteophosphoglycan 5 [Rhodotorula toruloides ATCC 204091]|uniref:Proteophosphoglycan 5 n=1 Tax=Rhodotorula toruloides TaxID=5286 RepID=A0A0K3CL35_RHOTO|nr:Proteophosphoglycan 5 [Rhodotorula toruloides ATCC 204091]PRQ71604.1 Proteophosphoglycan 5 [Rhodotorula toruloides]
MADSQGVLPESGSAEAPPAPPRNPRDPKLSLQTLRGADLPFISAALAPPTDNVLPPLQSDDDALFRARAIVPTADDDEDGEEWAFPDDEADFSLLAPPGGSGGAPVDREDLGTASVGEGATQILRDALYRSRIRQQAIIDSRTLKSLRGEPFSDKHGKIYRVDFDLGDEQDEAEEGVAAERGVERTGATAPQEAVAGAEPEDGAAADGSSSTDEAEPLAQLGSNEGAVYAIPNLAALSDSFADLEARRPAWVNRPLPFSYTMSVIRPASGTKPALGRKCASVDRSLIKGASKAKSRVNVQVSKLPAHVATASVMFGPASTSQCHVIASIAYEAETTEEVEHCLGDPSLASYLDPESDTTDTFGTIRKKVRLTLEGSFGPREGTSIAGQCGLLLLEAVAKDGHAETPISDDTLPQLASSSSSGKAANEAFVVGHVGFGSVKLATSLIAPNLRTVDKSAFQRRLGIDHLLSANYQSNGAIALHFPGGRKVKEINIAPSVNLPPPDAPRSAPLHSFRYRPGDPPDRESRLRLLRPTYTDAQIQRILLVVEHLDSISDGIVGPLTAVPSVRENLQFWKKLRSVFIDQVIERYRPQTERVLYQAYYHSGVQSYQILRGSLVQDGFGVSASVRGLSAIADQALAENVAREGSELLLLCGNRIVAERAMCIAMDVAEKTLTPTEAQELVLRDLIDRGSKVLVCAVCLVPQDASNFWTTSQGARDKEGQGVRVLCKTCSPPYEPPDFVFEFETFASLLEARRREGQPSPGTTASTLAKEFDGVFNYSRETGYGVDAYTKQRLQISAKGTHGILGSVDAVLPLPLDEDGTIVKHTDDRNVVFTSRTLNLAMGGHSRHVSEAITTMVCCASLLAHIAASPDSDEKRKIISAIQKLQVSAQEAYCALRGATKPFKIFRKAAGSTGPKHLQRVRDVLGKRNPLERFAGIVSAIDTVAGSWISMRPRDDPLPGSSDWLLAFEEYKDLNKSVIEQYKTSALQDVGEAVLYKAVTEPAPPLSRLERACLASFISDLEETYDFQGFYRIDGEAVFLSAQEVAEWQAVSRRAMTFDDVLDIAAFRHLRWLWECDKKYRDDPRADTVEASFLRLLQELYLEVALREDIDMLVGPTFIGAQEHPRAAGLGHRVQGRPMTTGAKVVRPKVSADIDLKVRNIGRRLWHPTRNYSVSLQQLDADGVAHNFDIVFAAVHDWTTSYRFKALSRPEQDLVGRYIKQAQSEGIVAHGPWVSQGMLAKDIVWRGGTDEETAAEE